MKTISPKNTLYIALMLSASLTACGGNGNKAGVNASAQAEDTKNSTKQAAEALEDKKKETEAHEDKKKEVEESDNKKKEETSNQQSANSTKKVIKSLTDAEKASAASKKEEERETNGVFYKSVIYKDKEGKVLFVESFQAWTAGEYTGMTITRNTYNAAGQLIKSSKITGKNKDGSPAQSSVDITNTYDANGKKATSIETTVTYDGGKPLLSTGRRETRKYDDKGNVIDIFSEGNLQANGSYAENIRIKTSTKTVGNLVSVLESSYTNGVFDSAVLSETTRNAKDPSKVDKTVLFNKADENGKKISGRHQNTYEYHNNGKLKKRVFSYIKYDPATDKVTVLIPGEVTFEYNDKGKQTFYLFKTDKNDDGVVDRQEMKQWEYAADGVTWTKYTTGTDFDGDGAADELKTYNVVNGKPATSYTKTVYLADGSERVTQHDK